MTPILTPEQVAEIHERACQHPLVKCPNCGYLHASEWLSRGVLREVCASHEALRSSLLNLLARAHGDGGHYTEAVGLERAIADAHDTIAFMYTERDEVIRLLNGKTEELDEERGIALSAMRDGLAECERLRWRVRSLEVAISEQIQSAEEIVSALDARIATLETGLRETQVALEKGHAKLRQRALVRLDALLAGGKVAP